MTAESMRERFDEWWYDAFQFRRDYNKHKPTNADFEIWQAATLAERERCAKVCDGMSGSDFSPAQCAEAIRKGDP